MEKLCAAVSAFSRLHGIPAVIVAGDFNCDPDGLAYTRMVSHGYHSLYKTFLGAEPEFTTLKLR